MEPDKLPDDVRELLRRAQDAGSNVTEPGVLTRVAKALSGLPQWQPAAPMLTGQKVVLFMDIDGITSAQGDSRYDELSSSVIGKGLWRWWPHLREVLEQYPGIEVVVHSSWRQIYPSLEWLRPVLPADLAQRVVAITDPNIYSRHDSIEAYLAVHADIGAYVVLDDNDCFPGYVPLVLCDSQRGMSDPAKVQELRNALSFAEARAQANWTAERRHAYAAVAINGARAHPERLARASEALTQLLPNMREDLQHEMAAWREAIEARDWNQLFELSLRSRTNPLMVTLHPSERTALYRRFSKDLGDG